MKKREYIKFVGNTVVISPEPEEGFLPAEVDYSAVEEWERPEHLRRNPDEEGETQSCTDTT